MIESQPAGCKSQQQWGANLTGLSAELEAAANWLTEEAAVDFTMINDAAAIYTSSSCCTCTSAFKSICVCVCGGGGWGGARQKLISAAAAAAKSFPITHCFIYLLPANQTQITHGPLGLLHTKANILYFCKQIIFPLRLEKKIKLKNPVHLCFAPCTDVNAKMAKVKPTVTHLLLLFFLFFMYAHYRKQNGHVWNEVWCSWKCSILHTDTQKSGFWKISGFSDLQHHLHVDNRLKCTENVVYKELVLSNISKHCIYTEHLKQYQNYTLTVLITFTSFFFSVSEHRSKIMVLSLTQSTQTYM